MRKLSLSRSSVHVAMEPTGEMVPFKGKRSSRIPQPGSMIVDRANQLLLFLRGRGRDVFLNMFIMLMFIGRL